MSVDRFGPLAQAYAAYRPRYPEALYDWLAAQCLQRRVAWDCGAGSGQATLPLSRRFSRVIATDISQAQLGEAPALDNVAYRVAPAEASGLDAASVDLLAVAQALHWFDLDRFHAEARRVLVPGGVIAAWTYGVPALEDPAAHAAFRYFHDHIVGPYWPAERHKVGEGYLALPFPFPKLAPPPFRMHDDWTLDTLLGYLRSWSATGAYVKTHGRNPVDEFTTELVACWGDRERRIGVDWPLTVIAGRTDSA